MISTKKTLSSTTVFNIDNNHKRNVSRAANRHIRMISEGVMRHWRLE